MPERPRARNLPRTVKGSQRKKPTARGPPLFLASFFLRRLRLRNLRRPRLNENRLGGKAEHVQIQVLAPIRKLAHILDRHVEVLAQKVPPRRIENSAGVTVERLGVDLGDPAPDRPFPVLL